MNHQRALGSSILRQNRRFSIPARGIESCHPWYRKTWPNRDGSRKHRRNRACREPVARHRPRLRRSRHPPRVRLGRTRKGLSKLLAIGPEEAIPALPPSKPRVRSASQECRGTPRNPPPASSPTSRSSPGGTGLLGRFQHRRRVSPAGPLARTGVLLRIQEIEGHRPQLASDSSCRVASVTSALFRNCHHQTAALVEERLQSQADGFLFAVSVDKELNLLAVPAQQASNPRQLEIRCVRSIDQDDLVTRRQAGFVGG